MKIDIGSGGFKREGFVGVDSVPSPDTDFLCNLETDPLPFDDNSVSYVFSSHCFEHIQHDKIVPIFTEFSRVCHDGAMIEIWNPYAFHRDGYVIGHITFLTEEIYHHLCGLQDLWCKALGARWNLKEIRYHVPPTTLADAREVGMSADFAVTHLNQVVKEFGVFIEINKAKPPSPHAPLRMLVDEIASRPMRETRELNRRPISEEPVPIKRITITEPGIPPERSNPHLKKFDRSLEEVSITQDEREQTRVSAEAKRDTAPGNASVAQGELKQSVFASVATGERGTELRREYEARSALAGDEDRRDGRRLAALQTIFILKGRLARHRDLVATILLAASVIARIIQLEAKRDARASRRQSSPLGPDPRDPHREAIGAARQVAEVPSAEPDLQAAWYLTQNPDVAFAAIDPRLHYLEHGMAEGRAWPSLHELKDVDVAWYLAQNPTLRRPGSIRGATT